MNRTVPQVDPVPLFASFSPAPTAEEITRARVFGEPLFPIGGTPRAQENLALAQAIQAFQAGGDVEDVTPFGTFLTEHPQTPWRAALLMNLGVLYRRVGYFTRATEVLQEAWMLARDKQDAGSDATASRAMGELLEIRTMFGQQQLLEALLSDVGERPLAGDAANRLRTARATAWTLRNEHDKACPSGPVALDKIRAALGMGGPERHPESLAFPPTHEGASLAEMAELSGRMGLRTRMAHRTSGAALPLPAMVHFKQNHFSAITRVENGRYLLNDPFLGGEVWISQAALDEEASGYFLVLDGPLQQGWRPATEAEASNIRGKCGTPMPAERNTNPSTPSIGGTITSTTGNPVLCPAMATYTFHPLLANLHITDTPVGYSPPIGPAPRFQLSHNYRESYQPATFTFSNFGQKWVFDWIAYVEDNPSAPGGSVTLFTRGGGSAVYFGVNGAGSTPETLSRSQLVLVSTSPIRYEQRGTDGSVQVYTQADGAMTMPRRIFLTQEIDPQGNALTFSYDTQLRLVSVTDAIGQVSTLSYGMPSQPLQITRVTDPFGRFATFEYNAAGQLWRITDVIGIQSSFEYALTSYIHSLTTPYGTTLFSYGSDHFWSFISVTATDPLGGTEKIFWGAGSIPASEPASVVPTGFTNNTALNVGTFYWSKRAWALYPDDFTKAHTMKWRVDSQTNKVAPVLASEKKPLENRVWYEHVGGAIPNSVGTTGKPARIGRVLDDGTSQIYRYEYNSKGKPTRETDPLGRETVYEYDTNEIDLLRIKQKNPASAGAYDLKRSFTHNGQHRHLTVVDASGQTTSYTYNAAGQLLTLTSPPRAGITENRTTTYSYDTNGYLQSVTGPATGAATSYTYDGYGRVRTSTDSDNYTLTTDYDALDRATRVTYPDGTYRETVYNRLDPEQRRDRSGRWSYRFHDALRRLTATRDAAGRTVTRVWCACGSLDKLIDANNNATVWERDAQGRTTREVHADASAREFTYEATTSRLKKIKDAKDQETQYAYFLDDKLQQISYVNAPVTTPNVSLTYDSAHGWLASMNDGTGNTTYNHYPIAVPPSLGAGRLASVDGPLSNDTVSYTYDELGRTVSRTLSGVTTTWAYDNLGRITSLIDGLGGFGYSYEGTTRRVSLVTYPNGQSTTYAYQPNSGDHRLGDMHHKTAGGTTLSRFTYAYDALGNLQGDTQQADTNPATAHDYAYDAADQIAEAIYRTTAPTPTILKRYAYAYDPAGNRTAEQVDDSGTSSSYDNMNRLVVQQAGGALVFKGLLSEAAGVSVQGEPAAVTTDNQFQGSATVPSGTSDVVIAATDPSGNVRTNTYQVTQSGASKTFTLDANGNLTGDGTRTYEWDAEDRLTAVVQGTARSEFSYDGRSRRTRIVERVGGAVVSDRQYVWCDIKLCEERSAGGSVIERRFLSHGMKQGPDSYLYVRDRLGSIREMTDSSGALRARYDYDPWGRRTKTVGDLESLFGYSGHFTHSSGLVMPLFRAYDPSLGRWLSEDPIRLRGGSNLYRYARNNPVRFRDPLGLCEGGVTNPDPDEQCSVDRWQDCAGCWCRDCAVEVGPVPPCSEHPPAECTDWYFEYAKSGCDPWNQGSPPGPTAPPPPPSPPSPPPPGEGPPSAGAGGEAEPPEPDSPEGITPQPPEPDKPEEIIPLQHDDIRQTDPNEPWPDPEPPSPAPPG